MRHASRAIGRTAAVVFMALFAAPALAQESEATWNSIRPQIFAERPIGDGAALIELVAPARAEDAAIVPLDVRLRASGGAKVKAVTLIVDENPSPVVATFSFGEGRQSFDISTRIRVDRYSHVRAIAETEDGKLHMVKSFVKAAGGCSAPASKDPAEARANVGELRFRSFAGVGRAEAQVQIRHPNYSGLQMDQVTRHYTPAWFVEKVTVKQGDTPIFSMEGGISISEDPTFRFAYRPSGDPVTIEAKDTDGNVFRRTFPGGEAS